MTRHPTFEAAITTAAAKLEPVALRTLADQLENSWPQAAILTTPPTVPADVIAAVLHAQETEAVPAAVAAGYLRGAAAGITSNRYTVQIESVWSGPATTSVPVRATAQVLTQLIDETRDELILMTYSAHPYRPVTEALTSATARGVTILAVIETLQGAGSALTGAEPAHAFADIPGVRLHHWPPAARAEPGAKMHAKVAISDRHTMLVSSANLTQSGITKNIEAGLLVRGGTAPARAAEHITNLNAQGVLRPLI